MYVRNNDCCDEIVILQLPADCQKNQVERRYKQTQQEKKLPGEGIIFFCFGSGLQNSRSRSTTSEHFIGTKR
ncbi:MAG: hypothetical protein OSJ52_14915 [Lachnospiraceae bacterium]|nr:hypothetical protein [Lachnospiraceae bacterium]